MTAVILCGGNSMRMGTDKGLLKAEEETWAERAARKLTMLGLPVFISINSQQPENYEGIFTKEQLVIDTEDLPVKGPLLGLLSVHRKFPNEDVFVLACDMKEMTTSLLEHLYKQCRAGKQEAYVYATGEKLQPLCGIYTAAGLNRIYHLLRYGHLKKFRMMHVLECLDTSCIRAKEEDFIFFNNYNHPTDLLRL